ncbi:hypothetical protein E2542_SST18939 [Spatholobus suberectus]|nr:hypothetical protein E2542_SST18939 [Spatholobus suberectus]
MARFISKTKTLLRHSQWAKGAIVCHRHRSSEATKSKWVEIDGVKLLEEHVRRIMVKKATPDWLPFLPGSSFWVPPPPSPFLHKFSISPQLLFIQDDESGNAAATPRGTEVTVQLKVLTPTENVALSEDEEG